MRTSGSRADAAGNRARLLEAVGRMLADERELTVGAIADEAGVSRSTAYRNFSTPTEAVHAFVIEFIGEFEQAVDVGGGVRGMCLAWGRLVSARSSALVHVRSTEGFLTRVRRDDEVIGRIYRVVRAVLAADPIAAGFDAATIDYAVFLWNLLLDPRELVDLAAHTDGTVEAATERLTDQFLSCLRHLGT